MYFEHWQWNYSQMIATEPPLWEVNIGSGNGLVPSGNKPFSGPMLIQIYVTTWHHKATMTLYQLNTLKIGKKVSK